MEGMLQRVMVYMEHQVRAQPDSLYTYTLACAMCMYIAMYYMGCESGTTAQLLNVLIYVCCLYNTVSSLSSHPILLPCLLPLPPFLPPSLSRLYFLGLLQPQTMAASIRTPGYSWQPWRELQGHMFQQRQEPCNQPSTHI